MPVNQLTVLRMVSQLGINRLSRVCRGSRTALSSSILLLVILVLLACDLTGATPSGSVRGEWTLKETGLVLSTTGTAASTGNENGHGKAAIWESEKDAILAKMLQSGYKSNEMVHLPGAAADLATSLIEGGGGDLNFEQRLTYRRLRELQAGADPSPFDPQEFLWSKVQKFCKKTDRTNPKSFSKYIYRGDAFSDALMNGLDFAFESPSWIRRMLMQDTLDNTSKDDAFNFLRSGDFITYGIFVVIAVIWFFLLWLILPGTYIRGCRTCCSFLMCRLCCFNRSRKTVPTFEQKSAKSLKWCGIAVAVLFFIFGGLATAFSVVIRYNIMAVPCDVMRASYELYWGIVYDQSASESHWLDAYTPSNATWHGVEHLYVDIDDMSDSIDVAVPDSYTSKALSVITDLSTDIKGTLTNVTTQLDKSATVNVPLLTYSHQCLVCMAGSSTQATNMKASLAGVQTQIDDSVTKAQSDVNDYSTQFKGTLSEAKADVQDFDLKMDISQFVDNISNHETWIHRAERWGYVPFLGISLSAVLTSIWFVIALLVLTRKFKRMEDPRIRGCGCCFGTLWFWCAFWGSIYLFFGSIGLLTLSNVYEGCEIAHDIKHNVSFGLEYPQLSKIYNSAYAIPALTECLQGNGSVALAAAPEKFKEAEAKVASTKVEIADNLASYPSAEDQAQIDKFTTMITSVAGSTLLDFDGILKKTGADSALWLVGGNEVLFAGMKTEGDPVTVKIDASAFSGVVGALKQLQDNLAKAFPSGDMSSCPNGAAFPTLDTSTDPVAVVVHTIEAMVQQGVKGLQGCLPDMAQVPKSFCLLPDTNCYDTIGTKTTAAVIGEAFQPAAIDDVVAPINTLFGDTTSGDAVKACLTSTSDCTRYGAMQFVSMLNWASRKAQLVKANSMADVDAYVADVQKSVKDAQDIHLKTAAAAADTITLVDEAWGGTLTKLDNYNCKSIVFAFGTALETVCGGTAASFFWIFLSWCLLALFSIFASVLAWKVMHYWKDRLPIHGKQRDLPAADAIDSRPSDLFEAVRQGDMSKTAYYANVYDPKETKDIYDNGLLHIAAAEGNCEEINYLLDCGCDVNELNAYGNTPLSVATHHDQTDAISLLIKRGGRVDIRDAFGETPLHSAARANQISAVETFVNCGVTGDYLNDEQMYPIDVARRNRSSKVVSVLEPVSPSDVRRVKNASVISPFDAQLTLAQKDASTDLLDN